MKALEYKVQGSSTDPSPGLSPSYTDKNDKVPTDIGQLSSLNRKGKAVQATRILY